MTDPYSDTPEIPPEIVPEVDSQAFVQAVPMTEQADVNIPSPPENLHQIVGMFEAIHESVTRLQADFETKIRYDDSKEKTINALHRELQDYRDDLVLKHVRPIVTDLITLHDDIGKIVAAYPAEPSADAVRLLESMRGFQLDIEEILNRNGIEAFEIDSDQFASPEQRVQKVIETDQAELDKRIAERVRKGFRYGERILRPEMVNIYRYAAPTQ